MNRLQTIFPPRSYMNAGGTDILCSPSMIIGGRIFRFDSPKVMGILNVTPDSFYAGSRAMDHEALRRRIEVMVDEGVDIIDIGGYSSRPGCEDVSEKEEYVRLSAGLSVLRDLAPDIPVSVDTFRVEIARRCVEEWDVALINDIGGGRSDEEMFAAVASMGVGYVLMHMRGTLQSMTEEHEYGDVVAEVLSDLAFRLSALREAGVDDVIVDPGFGFAKGIGDNFRLLEGLEAFSLLNAPLLVGISRKSMIWRTLGTSPEESLNATTALHMAALERGANILRVHDVRQAKECIRMYEMLHQHPSPEF